LAGNQSTGINLRDDCITETSAAFAVRSRVAAVAQDNDTVIARNLLNYAWRRGGFPATWMPGTRGGAHGDTMGLLAWDSATEVSASEFYKDDDARGLLAGALTASLLQRDEWAVPLADAMLANLRLTGVSGFGPASGGFPDLQTAGWQSVYRSNYSDNDAMYSPHYQSYLVGCGGSCDSETAQFCKAQPQRRGVKTLLLLQSHPLPAFPTSSGPSTSTLTRPLATRHSIREQLPP
jgi:hypothetical protein